MKLLHVDSSPLGGASVSREVTAAIVAQLLQADPGAEVTYRDLAASPPNHLSAEILAAMMQADPAALSAEQKAELALSETLVTEFLAADVVVIGAPMYNFSIPTQLKAWLDRIARAGRTFRYTENGAVGLAGGKRVFIASSRGGIYAGTPAETALDHQEAYLKAFLAFVGITEPTIVRAEGAAMGPEARAKGLGEAHGRIAELFEAQAA
ncbi:FMN-dependent NADH-azoreductase [Arenibaculum pallidiluteum]|uniref:FMN-dependent NADH-azoreductase n=1 Tax=Arenibaculum pallidiluteum TaxID=2812559 RepID=UPI001A95D139|nr:NAD(P)H-dependent oxidoreductase [Arenibaculum pallidiluteum]